MDFRWRKTLQISLGFRRLDWAFVRVYGCDGRVLQCFCLYFSVFFLPYQLHVCNLVAASSSATLMSWGHFQQSHNIPYVRPQLASHPPRCLTCRCWATPMELLVMDNIWDVLVLHCWQLWHASSSSRMRLRRPLCQPMWRELTQRLTGGAFIAVAFYGLPLRLWRRIGPILRGITAFLSPQHVWKKRSAHGLTFGLCCIKVCDGTGAKNQISIMQLHWFL